MANNYLGLLVINVDPMTRFLRKFFEVWFPRNANYFRAKDVGEHEEDDANDGDDGNDDAVDDDDDDGDGYDDDDDDGEEEEEDEEDDKRSPFENRRDADYWSFLKREINCKTFAAATDSDDDDDENENEDDEDNEDDSKDNN